MQPHLTPEFLAAQGLSPTFPERFWTKVNKDGPIPEHVPELGQCWVWVGSRCPNGYGSIKRGSPFKSSKSAHRASWLINMGVIPNEMLVLHKCDNVSCVNPEHLYVGTATDNNQDTSKRKRHRSRKGENNNSCKLTEQQVLGIRASLGTPPSKIAIHYGVSVKNVRMILRRETWTHI